MKILRFLAPIFLLAATAFGQVVLTQPPGTYTDNSLIVRDGTGSKVKNASTLLFTTSANPGAPNRTLKIGSNVGDSQLLIVGGSTAGNTANSFNFELHDGSDVLTQAYGLLFDLGLSRWSTIYWSTLSSAYVEQSHFDPATNVTTFTNGLSAPVLTSTVATGTAPFVVASTTLVANLHAATADSSTSTTTATNATNGATVSTSTNASFFPLFAASSTNSNQPFNLGTGLTFNPSTNNLSTTTFTGALSGNATTATNATNTAITDDTATNATMYPTWVTTTTGNLPQKISSTKMTFNPSTATLTVANLAGNASTATSATSSTSATNATNIGVTDDTTTNATMYPTWVTTTTGNLPAKLSSTKMTFNPSTATLTVANLAGNASTATSATNSTNQAVTDDTTTNATVYPVWVTANTGNLPQKVSSTKLFYNPSTSLLTVSGNLTIGASTSQILGAAGNMTIIAGTGNSRTMALQTTTSGGVATTALSLDASQNATVTGNLTVTGSTITTGGSTIFNGGAGNMQITAGTGNSRQMTLRTTTSGGTATTALTLGADQSATFAGTVNATSPAFTTSLTTPSTTFALLNTTATTVNAFGAATTVNTGAAATQIWNFGGSTTASEFRFLEPSGSGTNYTAFKAVAQGANITYSLPATVGGAGTFLRDAAGNGVLDWATPTAGAAGSDTYVQFNDGGTALGGDAGMTYNKTTDSLTLAGTLTTGSGASTAGAVALTQGTTQSTGTTNVTIQAPAAVTSYIATLPGTVGTNGAFWTQTTSGSTATIANSKVVPTGTVLGDTDTQTLTNKRVTARITSITSSATPTVNTDNCDCVTITALAAAITSMTTNLTGTPVNFDQLEYRIKDDGTARAITWGASFASGTGTLPTTTTISKVLHAWFEWDSVQSKWICASAGSEP